MVDDTQQYGDITATSSSFGCAWADILGGICNVSLWGLLGWQDIKQRYRRSTLGPFWITISTAIMVGALGYLYAGLFHQNVAQYLPFVADGIVVWGLISSIANEACSVFVTAESIIKQIRLPLTVHICRMIWKNFIIFFHNFVILALLYLYSGSGWQWSLLSIPFALLIIAINSVWIGILLGIFCTRFRDISPIIASLTQLLFFLTPIMWRPEVLKDREWVADYNPAYYFIQLIRAPLMGEGLPVLAWAVTLIIALAGMWCALSTLTRFRHRVAYWL